MDKKEIEIGGLVEEICENWTNGNISEVKEAFEQLKGKEAAKVGFLVWSLLARREAISFGKWLCD